MTRPEDEMPIGVVVMAYGTPASREDIESYYTHIRRGRAPSEDQLADLSRRYAAIGGISPLRERTIAQMNRVAESLEQNHPGRFVLKLGQKHASPFIEDAVAELADTGVRSVVGLVLAPHFSNFSVGQYHGRAEKTADSRGLGYGRIDDWSLEPELVEFLAGSLRDRLVGMPERTKVLFTAHSLPERVLADDPYPDRLRASADAVATLVGLQSVEGWDLGWQSAGRTPEPWRGPDILDIIRELAATGNTDGIVVVPQGFTSDHLEVLYDLDIEAAGVAAEAGIAFSRTAVPNHDPAVMSALARRVEAAAGA